VSVHPAIEARPNGTQKRSRRGHGSTRKEVAAGIVRVKICGKEVLQSNLTD
jgi:hypothetical protein